MSTSRHWLPIHVGDYLAETRHLTPHERDAYVYLKCEYWIKGMLPNDDAQLARIAGMTLPQWRRARPAIEPLFAAGWKHARLDAELARVAKLSVVNSERARHAANVRHGRERTEIAPSVPGACSEHATRDPLPASPPSEESPPQAAASLSADERPKKKRSKPPTPATLLPLDWTPSANDIAIAKKHGLTDLDIERDARKFLNYFSREKAVARKDWAATWENWTIGTAEKLGRTPRAATRKDVTPMSQLVWIAEDTAQWANCMRHLRSQGRMINPIDAQPGGPDTPYRRGYYFKPEDVAAAEMQEAAA